MPVQPSSRVKGFRGIPGKHRCPCSLHQEGRDSEGFHGSIDALAAFLKSEGIQRDSREV